MNRAELFERTHAVLVRIDLASSGKAQAWGGPAISHLKPSSIEPDAAELHERRVLEGPLLRWIRAREDDRAPSERSTVERFHAGIIAATERECDHLIDALAETETRLRIRWADGRHVATQSETADKLRDRMHREYLYRHFGTKTSTAARLENISTDQMRYVRRCHGIDGEGHRKEQCPEAVLQRSPHDYCAVCQIVEDLAREAA